MRLHGQPALNASGARLRRIFIRAVAGNDVCSTAEMLADSFEEDHAQLLVGGRDRERAHQAFHHHNVDRVAFLGTAKEELQHIAVAMDPQARDLGVVRCGAHRRENSSEMASNAVWRSRASPGTSGRRTAPCSRLGNRIVA